MVIGREKYGVVIRGEDIVWISLEDPGGHDEILLPE